MEITKIEKTTKTVGTVRESNGLEKVAQFCDAKNVSVNNKIDNQKRIDYIANRRKEKLLFTG